MNRFDHEKLDVYQAAIDLPQADLRDKAALEGGATVPEEIPVARAPPRPPERP